MISELGILASDTSKQLLRPKTKVHDGTKHSVGLVDKDEDVPKQKRRRKRSGKAEAVVGKDGEVSVVLKKQKKTATKITF